METAQTPHDRSENTKIASTSYVISRLEFNCTLFLMRSITCETRQVRVYKVLHTPWWCIFKLKLTYE